MALASTSDGPDRDVLGDFARGSALMWTPEFGKRTVVSAPSAFCADRVAHGNLIGVV